MRTTITRTIKTTHVYPSTMIVENGNVTVENLPRVSIIGEPTEKEQLKAVKEKYGKSGNYVVREIEVEEELYEISIEDFMKYATKVEK